jgi:hypothetical protein
VVIAIAALPIFFAFKLLRGASFLAYAVLGGVALKFTFAFRSLSDYTRPIAEALERGDGLRERGITLDEIVKAGLEMFIPHLGVESEEKAAEMLREELLELANDVNVCSLVLAGLRLEEDAKRGLIPGLAASSYFKNPCS